MPLRISHPVVQVLVATTGRTYMQRHLRTNNSAALGQVEDARGQRQLQGREEERVLNGNHVGGVGCDNK